ncbi:DUF748 domain-containing protein [Pontibacter beigongshangensis]|uniref:DUF748 domain-containing protein n=1 Tax=Pontibacter beigongshangensis TaxID=2574733 RepID=UPI0016501E8F|nr:DUF748 domain-containing protein [Pontibacter beigongshangensis]
MKKRYNKTFAIVAAVVVVLLLFRLALPSLVKRYVNKTLSELPGYNGYVEDIDLHLYRGAYTIDGLHLVEENGNPKYPFIQIKKTDLSVEWKSLLKGKVVSEIVMLQPEINFVEAPADSTNEPTREHWTEVVKDLMPITINRLEATQGRIAYLDFGASPDISLYIEQMHLVAHNLANVEKENEKLPSDITLTGSSIGGGQLKGQMKANALKEIPDFDMKMELTKVDLTAVNSFIEAYGKFDVERGTLDMYSELKLTDGQLDGYMKPFFEHVKVLNWKKDKEEGGFFRAAWEAIAGLFAEAAENQPRDQVATKVPIKGDISQMDTDLSTTIFNVLRHAFISAFNKGLESAPPAEE